MQLRRSGSYSSLDPSLDINLNSNHNTLNNDNSIEESSTIYNTNTTATSNNIPTTYRLDKVFLRRFYRILKLLFRSTPNATWFTTKKEGRQHNIFWLYITFFALACGTEVIVYYVGLIPSRFYGILTARDQIAFLKFMIPCFLLIFGVATGKALVKFMGGLVSLKIRRLLTNHLHDRYIKPKTMYALVLEHVHVDNPDQRVTQDVDKFAETMNLILENLIICPILVILYTWQCWSVAGFLGPFLIYIYFILGSILSRRFIQPIVTAVFYKELQEGNFRFLHVRLRQFAESIAFSEGEMEENQRAKASLDSLLTYQRSIVNKTLPLQLANQNFAYVGSILSYLIVSVPIFLGVYDDMDSSELSAIISKNSFVSMYLIFLFSTIIEQSDKISLLAGYVARIGELLESIDDIDNVLEAVKLESIYQDQDPVDSIIFENVTVVSPRGKTLVSNLNLKVGDGDHLVLVGRNGVGKSSLLRTLAGLWPCSNGRILLPELKHGKEIIFLPQTPYLVQGSLRDQLVYPSLTSTISVTDYDVRSLLKQVRLEHLEQLISSFDMPYGEEWDKLLSPGEQQKLVFARLLYWKPQFAVLDEATSAMDNETETYLYKLIKDAGITIISVSHRTEVIQYHQRKLLLNGDGSYQLENVL